MLGNVDHDSGAKVFRIKGAALWEAYQRVKGEENNEAHVWRRDTHGEIAIDFCLSHDDIIEGKTQRLELPDFIPR